MGRRRRSGGPAFSLFAFQDIITCVLGIMLLLTLIMSLQIVISPVTGLPSTMKDQANQLAAEATALLREISSLEQQIADQMAALNSGAILNSELLRQSRDIAVDESTAAQSELIRLEHLVSDSADRKADVDARFHDLDTIVQESARLEDERSARIRELEEIRSGRKRVYNAHNSAARTCWLVEISAPDDIRVALVGEEVAGSHFSSIEELLVWTNTQANQDAALMLLVKPAAAGSLEALSKSLVRIKVPYGFDLLPQEASVLDLGKEQPE